MRCLERNKRGFWYSLLSQTITGSDGESYNVYSLPTYMMANVSAVAGKSQTEVFGEDAEYDRVIVTDVLNCPIDEFAVLWMDKEPEYDDNDIPINWDYIVKRVAKHLDSTSYAVKRVDVT